MSLVVPYLKILFKIHFYVIYLDLSDWSPSKDIGFLFSLTKRYRQYFILKVFKSTLV